MGKLLTIKEAKELLGVCTKTIQRWDREDKIQCVRTPGNRRRVPESEVLRILGESAPRPAVPRPETERVRSEPPVEEKPKPAPKVKKPKKETPPAELARHAILDKLAPSGLAQRAAFGDILSAAIVLEKFTPEELALQAHCPENVVKEFCEKMSALNYLISENEAFKLNVRLAR